MDNNSEAWKNPSSFLKEVEKRIEDSLARRREEIERELLQKIEKEKEEAEKKIVTIKHEYEQIRHHLDEHKRVMAELQAKRDELYRDIHSRLERIHSHRKIIETTISHVSAECAAIDDLRKKITELGQQAENITASIKQTLDKTGFEFDVPKIFEIKEIPLNVASELIRLQKIKDLLTEEHKEEPCLASVETELEKPDVEPKPLSQTLETAETVAAPADVSSEPCPEEKIENEFYSESATPAARTEEIKPEEISSEKGLSLEEQRQQEIEEEAKELALAQFRRVENVGNHINLQFFESRKAKIVDINSLIQAFDTLIRETGDLHKQLISTVSLKDVFLTKQEILNKQELLRKTFLMTVKYCEKENGCLPGHIIEILNVDKLRDILERLTLGNWSDLSDFQSFITETRDIFQKLRLLVKSKVVYLTSLINQL